MYQLLANLTRLLHLGLIGFVVIVPFTKQKWPIFALHLAVVCSLMVHWAADQDACFLTLVESVLRGIHPQRSFVHQLVSPIYKIKDDELKQIVWIITPILGLISLSNLYHLMPAIKRDLAVLLGGRLQTSRTNL